MFQRKYKARTKIAVLNGIVHQVDRAVRITGLYPSRVQFFEEAAKLLLHRHYKTGVLTFAVEDFDETEQKSKLTPSRPVHVEIRELAQRIEQLERVIIKMAEEENRRATVRSEND